MLYYNLYLCQGQQEMSLEETYILFPWRCNDLDYDLDIKCICEPYKWESPSNRGRVHMFVRVVIVNVIRDTPPSVCQLYIGCLIKVQLIIWKLWLRDGKHDRWTDSATYTCTCSPLGGIKIALSFTIIISQYLWTFTYNQKSSYNTAKVFQYDTLLLCEPQEKFCWETKSTC